MIDTRSAEPHSRRGGLLRESGPEFRESAAPIDLTKPARVPGHGGLGRWLLDTLMVGLLHGGCIHHTHPTYVDVLRDLSRLPRPWSVFSTKSMPVRLRRCRKINN